MDKKSQQIKSLVREEKLKGKLTDMEQLMHLIPKELAASWLEKNEEEVDGLLKRVEDFTIKEIYSLGEHCGLGCTEIYTVFEAEYFKQKNK
ncbi:MAG: hypothetical protein JST68_00585 [Bacteroidetes bacterium]|nr:hypothetical protein [Bacteroidota bacterium]